MSIQRQPASSRQGTHEQDETVQDGASSETRSTSDEIESARPPSSKRRTPIPGVGSQSAMRESLVRTLSDRRSLRQAMVLQEIIGPPKALRVREHM